MVTGSSSMYFELVRGLLKSLAPHRPRFGFDLVVLDFGLQPAQIEELGHLGASVVRPWWCFDVPRKFADTPHNHAYGARCYLPTLVPGYDIYFWVDADAWVQDDRFYESFVGPARQGQLAIVHEKEPVYPHEWKLIRWSLGNMVLGYGPVDGVLAWLGRHVNNGVFAMRGDHPAWKLWARRFEQGVHRSGKIIFDQHSLLVCLERDRVPVTYLGGAFNWICSRAQPTVDARQRLCVPYPPYEPISIVQLAGPGKDLVHELATLDGGSIRRRLTFEGA